MCGRRLCVPRPPRCHPAGVEFKGASVVIIGHGSFAIENARHALEQGAASVTLLARHHVAVVSRAAGLFADRHVDKPLPAAAMLAALRKAHALVGRGDAELEALLFTPTKTMLPTSDFFFAARASGKLAVVIGEVARLGAASVETRAGATLGCDVLIKCCGFTPDKAFDKAMRSDLSKGGRVSTFHHSNSAIRMGGPTAPWTGGCVPLYRARLGPRTRAAHTDAPRKQGGPAAHKSTSRARSRQRHPPRSSSTVLRWTSTVSNDI